MTYVPAVGKRSVADCGKAAAVGAAFAEGDRVRHERLCLAEILDAEQSGVPQVRGVESIDDRRADDPGMRKASLGGRLMADGVIQRIDGAGAGGLNARIVVEAKRKFLTVREVKVDPSGIILFGIDFGIVDAEGYGAGGIYAKYPASSGGSLVEGVDAASQVVVTILQQAAAIGHRDGAVDTG